jgi:hypothetical protein
MSFFSVESIMKKRLVEMYRVNDRVEIYLKSAGGERWYSGRIIQHDNPGVWVEIGGGSHWFVTNRQRIRKADLDV